MACIEVENQVQTWCGVASFPSVILRPGPKGGVGCRCIKMGCRIISSLFLFTPYSSLILPG